MISLASAGMVLILAVLALTKAQAPYTADQIFLHQMVQTTQLFQAVFPSLLGLPAGTYALFAIGCVVALWVIYLWMLLRTGDGPVDPRLAGGGAVLLGLAALLVPPVFSSDVYSYAMFGRLASVYDLNPYLTTARLGAPDDPVMPFLHWRDIPSPYGPVWTLVSHLITFRHGPPLEVVLRFKAVSLGAVLGSGWLIYRMVRQSWPEEAGRAWLAFAWNPLILVEGVVTGHNDALILGGLLGSAYLMSRSNPLQATAGLAATTLVKYSVAPVAVLALFGVFARTPRSRRLSFVLTGGLVGAAVTLAAFLPWWAGVRGLASTLDEPGRGVNNPVCLAVATALVELTRPFVSLPLPTAAVASAAALFTGFLGWQAWRVWRLAGAGDAWSVHDELASWSLTIIVFLLVWPRVHTWYFLVPLGLAIAAGPRHRRLFWTATALSITSYGSYFL